MSRASTLTGHATNAPPDHDMPEMMAADAPPATRERLWTLFRVVFVLSALSWGGLALMAQLELHYVERERRFTRLQFSDFVALAWMAPGAVGCNVAVQVGYALRGRLGAWVAGTAAVLPFFITMSTFAVFYHSPFVSSLAAPALIDHFAVVLSALILITWHRQARSVVRGRLEWGASAVTCAVLLTIPSTSAFVVLLGGAFAAGWFASPARGDQLAVSFSRGDKALVVVLAVLIALFALPLPLAVQHPSIFVWPRLAGAAMTLFGGGFSALPILKTLFVGPTLGITQHDFTLAFALSAISPGPLLNIVPFLGYLTHGLPGAVAATVAFFVPSGVLIVFVRRHMYRLETHARFEHGMRVLRAATTSFLIVAVVHFARHVPFSISYLATAAFSLFCLAHLKLPVYVVYAVVALVYVLSTELGAH